MKIFIAQAMNGRDVEDVLKERNAAFVEIVKFINEPVELIDQVRVENPPENAGRLWYLGRSIQMLAEADRVYFVGRWWRAKGCIVERLICKLYGVAICEDPTNTIGYPYRAVGIVEYIKKIFDLLDKE